MCLKTGGACALLHSGVPHNASHTLWEQLLGDTSTFEHQLLVEATPLHAISM